MRPFFDFNSTGAFGQYLSFTQRKGAANARGAFHLLPTHGVSTRLRVQQMRQTQHEPVSRVTAAPCPNAGGDATAPASDELYAKRPILGACGPDAALATRETRLTTHRLSPGIPKRRPPARLLDKYLSWKSLISLRSWAFSALFGLGISGVNYDSLH